MSDRQSDTLSDASFFTTPDAPEVQLLELVHIGRLSDKIYRVSTMMAARLVRLGAHILLVGGNPVGGDVMLGGSQADLAMTDQRMQAVFQLVLV